MPRMHALVPLVVVLSTAAHAQGQSQELPAGHPPIDGPVKRAPPLAEGAQLPPNHPPLSGSAPSAPPLTEGAQLPPNHPPLSGSAGPGPVSEGTPLPPNHPPVDGTTPAAQPPAVSLPGVPSSEELMKRIEETAGLKDQEKTFTVAAALGKLYYTQGRYADAVTFYREAQAKAEPARAFYLERARRLGGRRPPPAEESGCAPGGSTSFEQLWPLAREKKDAGQAATCARAALDGLREVEAQLAQAQFILGQKGEALKTYERQLELFAFSPEARFGRAAVILDGFGDDVRKLKTAQADLKGYLADFPTSPRAAQAKQFLARIDAAVAAGGMSKLQRDEDLRALAQAPAPTPMPMPMPTTPPQQQQQPAAASAMPQLTPEMMAAAESIERTPELEAKMDGLVAEAEEALARGRFQDALDRYKQVMMVRAQSGRVQAGMAWSLIGLNKPMADRIWSVAVAASPADVDGLGDTLKTKGNPQGAKALWQRLAASAPEYAASANLSRKLQ